MAENPQMLERFQQYMSLRRPKGAEVDSWLTVYPVMEELGAAAKELDKDKALFVDIGGSIGAQSAQFREKHPDLPGRVINQDLPETVAKALPTPGVENIAHDFFEPQPIKGET